MKERIYTIIMAILLVIAAFLKNTNTIKEILLYLVAVVMVALGISQSKKSKLNFVLCILGSLIVVSMGVFLHFN